jgi:hypothetical protein
MQNLQFLLMTEFFMNANLHNNDHIHPNWLTAVLRTIIQGLGGGGEGEGVEGALCWLGTNFTLKGILEAVIFPTLTVFLCCCLFQGMNKSINYSMNESINQSVINGANCPFNISYHIEPYNTWKKWKVFFAFTGPLLGWIWLHNIYFWMFTKVNKSAEMQNNIFL